MFKTGDAVKCCPAVDPKTGLVIGGSHDGHVYALNPKVSGFEWTVNPHNRWRSSFWLAAAQRYSITALTI